jgi:hypothetical protein
MIQHLSIHEKHMNKQPMCVEVKVRWHTTCMALAMEQSGWTMSVALAARLQ